MSELEEFKKVVSPIAYGLAYKSKLGTTEYQQLYTEEDVIKYFSNKPQLTIPKSIADELDKVEMNWNTLKDEAQGWSTDDLIMWLDDGNNPLMFAYLASKALGVDLVKVVEG